MNKIVLSFIILLTSTVPLFAEIVLFSSNECRKDPLGGTLLLGCKDTSGIEICPEALPLSMSDGVLNSMERISIINYEYSCITFRPINPRLNFQGIDYPLIHGVNSITIRYLNGASNCLLFKLGIYPSNSVMPTCKIVVTSTVTQPDNIFYNAVTTQWKIDKERLERDIINHRASSKSFHEITELIQTFHTIENLFDLFGKHGDKNSEIRDQIKVLIQCDEEQSLEECNILDNLLIQTSKTLSIAEKRAISKLIQVLLDILEDSSNCADFSLDNYLSEKQLEVLNTMVRRKENLEENEENYLKFKNLENDAEKELRSLWCQSKNHIDWNGANYGDCN